MSDDHGAMSLVIAATNDESTRERLKSLQAELAKLKVERAEIEAVAARNQETLAEISAVQRAMEEKKTELDAQLQKVVNNTHALTTVINNHEAERERWEAVRKTVDAEHAAREAALRDAEAEMATLRAEHEARDRDLHHRETSVTAREHAHHRRHQAIEAALKVG